MPSSALPCLRWFLAAMLAVMALQVAPAAAQGDEVDIEVFYRELEPHGRWLEHPDYGEVWAPDVDPDWRPYTRGQWVHTEEHGWYWESEEPFGWIVYHYGRWFRDEANGWVWVPGTEWGPAWVAWRYSDEDVGWAPLPPEAEWRGGEIAFADNFYDSPRFSPAWCFVPVALLAAPRIWTRIAPSRRNSYFLGRTRFSHGYRSGRFGIYNGGFDHRRYERLTGRELARRRIVPTNRRFDGRPRGGRDEILVYRPRVTGIPPGAGAWSGRRSGVPGGGSSRHLDDGGRRDWPGRRDPSEPGRTDRGRGGGDRNGLPPRTHTDGRGEDRRGGFPRQAPDGGRSSTRPSIEPPIRHHTAPPSVHHSPSPPLRRQPGNFAPGRGAPPNEPRATPPPRSAPPVHAPRGPSTQGVAPPVRSAPVQGSGPPRGAAPVGGRRTDQPSN